MLGCRRGVTPVRAQSRRQIGARCLPSVCLQWHRSGPAAVREGPGLWRQIAPRYPRSGPEAKFFFVNPWRRLPIVVDRKKEPHQARMQCHLKGPAIRAVCVRTVLTLAPRRCQLTTPVALLMASSSQSERRRSRYLPLKSRSLNRTGRGPRGHGPVEMFVETMSATRRRSSPGAPEVRRSQS